MRGAHGYLLETGPEGMREADGIRCNHCQRVDLVPPKEQRPPEYGFCHGCAMSVCAKCYAEIEVTGCKPWEARLEAMERRARLRSTLTGAA